MKRLLISTCTVFLLVTSALIAAGSGPNSIIALDWHGTHLYVLTPTTVTMYDAAGRIRLATTKLPSGFRAAGIVTRRLGDHEHVFVSGFYGREGMIYDYETITTAPPDHYATPDQAAAVDFDPGRRTGRPGLYVASAVTNEIYFMDLDLRGAVKTVAYIPAATAIGPIIFDQLRNHLIVGDTGRSSVFDVDLITGTFRPIPTTIKVRPVSFAFDETFATLYVADRVTGRIYTLRADASGIWSVRDTIVTGSRGLSSLAPGPRNTLFVGDMFLGLQQLSIATKKLSPLLPSYRAD